MYRRYCNNMSCVRVMTEYDVWGIKIEVKTYWLLNSNQIWSDIFFFKVLSLCYGFCWCFLHFPHQNVGLRGYFLNNWCDLQNGLIVKSTNKYILKLRLVWDCFQSVTVYNALCFFQILFHKWATIWITLILL